MVNAALTFGMIPLAILAAVVPVAGVPLPQNISETRARVRIVRMESVNFAKARQKPGSGPDRPMRHLVEFE